MPWRTIIDQENAAAESNGQFFNKTNRFKSIRPKRIGESIRIGMLYFSPDKQMTTIRAYRTKSYNDNKVATWKQ